MTTASKATRPCAEDFGGVFFQPWIGDQYAGRKSLLVLGESHYGEGAADPLLTQRMTCDFVDGKHNHRFCTTVARTINGQQLGLDACRQVWRSIGFYNYVQESVGPDRRCRPTERMWKAAQRPFLQMLEEQQPLAVLALGRALWSNLPDARPTDLQLENGMPLAAKIFRLVSGTQVLAASIAHPASRGFSRTKWPGLVPTLITQAERLGARGPRAHAPDEA